ncbi:MAG: tetratricopeptide repeat protein [Candidatus Manganitrophaceae bacterium]
MRWKRTFVWLLLPFYAACGTHEAQLKKEKEGSAYYKLGVSYLNDNLLQKASIEFQKAIETDPNNREAHYALGHVHFVQESYGQALVSFKKALSIDPVYSEAHNYLGKVYEIQGKPDEAIAEFEAALKNPHYDTPEKAHFNIGLIYAKQEKFEQAIRSFQSVLRVAPPDATGVTAVAYHEIGKAQARMGKPKEAIVSYQEAVRIAPNFLDAQLSLASAFLKDGSKDLAAGTFKKIVELSPESPQGKEAQKFLDTLR